MNDNRPPTAPEIRWANCADPLPAFSLIELLMVMAIILILTTLYWRSSAGSRHQRTQTVCLQNLQKVFMGLEIYANDQTGKFPVKSGARTAEEALDLLVPHYTIDTAPFICPGSKDPPLPGGESFRTRTISYAYYMGRASQAAEVLLTDRQVNTLPKNAGEQIFSTSGARPGNNHQKGGGNLLFCDGHAQSIPPLAPFSLVFTQQVVLLNPK